MTVFTAKCIPDENQMTADAKNTQIAANIDSHLKVMAAPTEPHVAKMSGKIKEANKAAELII